MNKNVRIAFVGPSGCGKSSCYKLAKTVLEDLKYYVVRCDAALPLRQIQFLSHKLFELPDCGNPEIPETFNQDGKLLSFLASHYEQYLSKNLEYRIKYVENVRSVALINTDCRNNCYEILKNLGFKFIKISISEEILSERRKKRGDLSAFDPNAAVEQINQIKADFEIENNSTFDVLEHQIKDIIASLQTRRWGTYA